jgi:hypothetical protein
VPPHPQGRPIMNWALMPPVDPAGRSETWSEPASIPLVRELLRKHAEISSYGTRRFSGTRAQRNASWYHYRNFLRQALSNFDAAIQVSNRSACLLYYYALLNFAKAELMNTHAAQVVNTRIYHGLTFDVTRAATISGDRLRINNGVFPLLYERRVGRPIANGEFLSIKRVLGHVPEVSTQLADTGIGSSAMFPAFHLIANNGPECWPVLLTFNFSLNQNSNAGRLFFRNFREIQLIPNWRDVFGLSRRAIGSGVQLFESIDTAQNLSSNVLNIDGANAITWRLREMITYPLRQSSDVLISPSLYITKWLPMPASIARYAMMFYASSLVRYRPSMFDAQLFPEQAYLFDAIARECALPILVDVLSALEGKPQLFMPEHGYRL